MLAVFAEFEREILREHVKAGIAQARADRFRARDVALGFSSTLRPTPGDIGYIFI
jgi:DNA invertase Pin-like site-specific DNA recombinase